MDKKQEIIHFQKDFSLSKHKANEAPSLSGDFIICDVSIILLKATWLEIKLQFSVSLTLNCDYKELFVDVAES